MVEKINLQEARKEMKEFKDKNPETYIELFIAGGYRSKREVEHKLAAIKEAHPGWVTISEGYAIEGTADLKAVVLHYKP